MKKHDGAGDNGDVVDEEEEVLDKLVDNAMARLLSLRTAYAEEEEEGDLWVYVYPRIAGWRWAAANRGVVADSSIAYARKHAVKWCKKFGWPRQRGFAFATHG